MLLYSAPFTWIFVNTVFAVLTKKYWCRKGLSLWIFVSYTYMYEVLRYLHLRWWITWWQCRNVNSALCFMYFFFHPSIYFWKVTGDPFHLYFINQASRVLKNNGKAQKNPTCLSSSVNFNYTVEMLGPFHLLVLVNKISFLCVCAKSAQPTTRKGFEPIMLPNFIVILVWFSSQGWDLLKLPKWSPAIPDWPTNLLSKKTI